VWDLATFADALAVFVLLAVSFFVTRTALRMRVERSLRQERLRLRLSKLWQDDHQHRETSGFEGSSEHSPYYRKSRE
jgi:hypothetical protein